MDKKILALSLVLLLTTVIATSIATSTVKASSSSGSGWITSYDIYDYSSNQHLYTYNSATGTNQSLAPIVPGAEVKVTFTVNVFTGGSGNLQLATSLTNPPSGQYWTLNTQTYTMGSGFNPDSASTQFNWVTGTFSMTVAGVVPSSSSQTAATVNLVSLYGPDGSVLDQISVTATTSQMSQFETQLNKDQQHLQSLKSEGIAQGYIDIYSNVLAAAQTAANAGNVNDAINMLNALETSNEPASSASVTLYIAIIAVVAVVAVVFAVMFMRIRGKVSYFQLVVEDQIKDLEGLSMRISRIDRAASSNLESVKDRLKRLVGM